MGKKKLLCVALALLLICLNLTSCGGADSNASHQNGGAGPGSTGASQESSSDTNDMMGWDSGNVDTSAPEDSGTVPSQPHDKLIYRANMELETTAFDQVSQDLETLVAALDGYFESRSVSNYSTYRRGSYVIRVPAENFQQLLTQVGQLCLVRSQYDSADNVSEAYYDLEARLATQRTKLERLQTLLAQAETMEDIITIESAISDTELEIEYLTGSLRSYDSLISYSTVEITLDEVYRLSNVEEPVVGFGGRLVSALSSGFRTGLDAVENLIIGLAYNWFFILLLAIVVTVVILLVRRKRRPSDPPPSVPPAGKKED